MQYAKAIVAVIGVGVTTLLGLIPPSTTLWIVLTVASAMLTALGVYLVPNAPKPLDGGLTFHVDARDFPARLTAAEGEANVRAAFPEDHYTTGGDE